VLAVAVIGCKREAPTRWDVSVKAPLVEGRLTWADLVADTLLETEGGVLHLIYESDLIDFELDSLTRLEDTVITTSFTPGFSGGPINIPPGTTVFSSDDDLSFGISSAQINEVHIAAGRMNYRLKSYVGGPLNVSYALPGVALPEGGTFALQTTTGPAEGDSPFIFEGARDLAGVEIDLQGAAGGAFNKLATLLNVSVAAEAADAVPVFGNDSLRIELSFEDVVISYGRGYFGQFSDESVDTLDVSPFVESLGYLNFDELSFSLSIVNSVGVDAQLELNSIRAERGFESVELTHSLVGSTTNLTRAIDQGNGEIAANTYNWEVDEGNSNITSLFGLLPERLVIDRAFELNPLGDISGGNDFIYTDQPVEASFMIDVPLAFSSDGVYLRDTLTLDPVETELEGEAALQFSISNGFPLQIDQIDIRLLTETGAYPLLTNLAMPASNWNGESYQTIIQEHTQVLSADHIAALRDGGIIEIEVQFETVATENIAMNGQEFIDVEIIGDGLVQIEVE
jgi:hypothetical protein